MAAQPQHFTLFNSSPLGDLVQRSGFEFLETTTPGRLDAQFVRAAALKGEVDLAADGMPSHMWLVARRFEGAPR